MTVHLSQGQDRKMTLIPYVRSKNPQKVPLGEYGDAHNNDNNNWKPGMNCTVIHECGDVMTGSSSLTQRGRSTLKHRILREGFMDHLSCPQAFDRPRYQAPPGHVSRRLSQPEETGEERPDHLASSPELSPLLSLP